MATKKENFASTITILEQLEDTKDLVKFYKEEIDRIDCKVTKAKNTLTKEQRGNLVFKSQITAILTDSEGLRAGDISKSVNLSIQKVTALLSQLVKAGKVKRNEGKVTIFTIV